MTAVAAQVARTESRPGEGDEADGRALAAAVAWAGVAALIVFAPFEALRPLLRLPGQSLSTVEVALLGVLAAWTATLLRARALPVWRTQLTAPWVALLIAMLIAAAFAPAHRGNALAMVGRLTLAFAVYLLTVNAINSPARVKRTLIVAGVAAACLWPLIALEYAGAPAVSNFLEQFRSQTATVGGHVRAGGPFAYPTIASMYLEILFALILGLLVVSLSERRIGRALAACVVLAAAGQAVVLTFTRAGLITLAAASAIVGYVAWRKRVESGPAAIAAVLLLVGIQFPVARSFELIGLRLTSEGQLGWYRASFDAPADVALPAGGVTTIPISVTNTGRTTWDSEANPPFRLSYHWLFPDNRVVSWQGLRTNFPSPVPSGAAVALPVRVEAPMRSGEYRIMWDIERENSLWFSTEPGASMFVSRAKVTGPDVGPLGLVTSVPLPQPAARLGRLALWRAAVRMFAERPITGVGPDNYRLLYGGYAGVGTFDTRVHTNNMYLEVLVSAGLLGGLAFMWFCWRAFREFAAASQAAADRSRALMGAGVAAAGGAIAIHGVADSFLSFTATYILIAITLGLASACVAINRSHAHRV
jgi:O-antigen ligase/polysaccharide polymerase Wzy-like membrane protein